MESLGTSPGALPSRGGGVWFSSWYVISIDTGHIAQSPQSSPRWSPAFKTEPVLSVSSFSLSSGAGNLSPHRKEAGLELKGLALHILILASPQKSKLQTGMSLLSIYWILIIFLLPNLYGLKVGLKLNIQKTKMMASGPITSWQIDGETMETVTDFIFFWLQNHCQWWLKLWNYAWQLPAELRDSCLVTCLIIASWAAWFVTAELHGYCLLIAWFVSAQLFEYCLLRSLFGRHLPGTSPNWSRVFEGEMA